MQPIDKVICINTFSGKNIYVRTTEEMWKELTKDTEVFTGDVAIGWRLDQQKIENIITGAYPEREHYHVIPVEIPQDRPTPNYHVVYSSFDKPETS